MNLSWFGACMLSKALLERSKAEKGGSESFGAKMARVNFPRRAEVVRNAVNSHGIDGEHAAESIQRAFFTDVETKTLARWVRNEVKKMRTKTQYKVPVEAMGDLQP